MNFKKNYNNFQIQSFWSGDVSKLIEKLITTPAKSYATQHDLVLTFINDKLFGGKGKPNKEFREKGRRYFDLKVPRDGENGNSKIIELKVHTSQLKYLKNELKKREVIFSNSDGLYFSFLLQVRSKKVHKIIKDRRCIYYLVIIKLSKSTIEIPINKLIDEIRMGTEDFTKELAKESKLDEKKEELLGVENIIKVVDLERKLEKMKKEKETYKNQLEKERKLRKEKEKEIKRLKAKLKENGSQ
ncbi:MAG: hypothetical protein ACOC1X_01260 [Promethearchaeota archaeon]